MHSDVVEALAARFKYEHRNACYPEATDFEARQAAEQFLAIAALAARDDVLEELEALKFAPSFMKGGKNYAQVSDQFVGRIIAALKGVPQP